MAQAQANGPGVAALQGALQAATAALAEIKQSKPKELELTGKPETNRRMWQDWGFAATQYLAVKDEQFVVSIDAAINMSIIPQPISLQPFRTSRDQPFCAFVPQGTQPFLQPRRTQ